MCTVTYIPKSTENSFILTSNRDEKVLRPTIPPKIYLTGKNKLAYPKDKLAGGSWIAANDTGKICCLLNGAYFPHKKQEYHTKSRGIILLEFAMSKYSTIEFFISKELSNVEPFTIIVIEQEKGQVNDLIELIWDGINKHYQKLDINKNYLWSSVTLYSEEQRILRKEWFNRFINKKNAQKSLQDVYNFHSGKHTEDSSINLLMNREGVLKTVSITQITFETRNTRMNYSDLLNNSTHQLSI